MNISNISRLTKSSLASFLMISSCLLPTFAKAQEAKNIFVQTQLMIRTAQEKGYKYSKLTNPNGQSRNQIESPVIKGIKGYNDFRLVAETVMQMPIQKSDPVRIFIRASSNKPELGNLGFTTIELSGENPEYIRSQIQASQVDLARQIEVNLSKKGLMISESTSKKSAIVRIIESVLFQKAHANNPVAQFMAGIVIFIVVFMTGVIVVEKLTENPKEFLIKVGIGSLLVAGAVATGLFCASLE
jgi:hypothetical protein